MPSFREIPDPNIDWKSIKYKNTSDEIRPEVGYRYCRKCQRILPINSYDFCRNKRNPDGYSYICKECSKKKSKS